MQNCFIEGELVYLRYPDVQKDVLEGKWHEWFNRNDITDYLYHGVYPNSIEKQVEIVKSNLERSDMVLLSVIEKSTDKHIGIVSLKDIDLLNRIAEITIVMDKGNFSKNAPFEAWALITKYGFEKLNLETIKAGHHEKLWKWINKTELLGYKLEGYSNDTHLRYGKKSSSVGTSISSSDYFDLLEKRDGKYLTNNIDDLLSQKRDENMCEKLKNLIGNLYE